MRRKTSAGNSSAAGRVRLFAALLIVAGGTSAAALAGAGEKKRSPSYALIAGTVFRDTGLSLPGAEVRLVPAGDPQAARKVKQQQAITDGRGEFAIRVPAAPMQYKLTVRAPGYQPQEKEVSISGDERIDVFLKLEAASNGRRSQQ